MSKRPTILASRDVSGPLRIVVTVTLASNDNTSTRRFYAYPSLIDEIVSGMPFRREFAGQKDLVRRECKDITISLSD